MQEVFEKIIEKLEERKKLHNRMIDYENKNGTVSEEFQQRKAVEVLNYAIEIVKQEAAEHNNGWIPCSERFPKVEDLHEKSVDDCTCYLIQRRGGIMDVAHYIKVYGEPYFEANSIKMKDVVAWHPLPELYNPNTCQDTNCPYNDGNDCPAADGCAGYERKRTNFDMCCESMEAMAQIIDIAKIGWTKEQIMEWLQSEVEE